MFLLPNCFFGAEDLFFYLAGHDAKLGMLPLNKSSFTTNFDLLVSHLVWVARDARPAEITHGKLINHVFGRAFQSLLWICRVSNIKWNTEDSDHQEHVDQLQQYFEEGVDAVTQNQIRILGQHSFRFWHLYVQFFQERLSKSMFEIWFTLHAFYSLKEFKTRYNMIVVCNLNQWVHVLNVHDCLVNLLPSQHISRLRIVCSWVHLSFVNAAWII